MKTAFIAFRAAIFSSSFVLLWGWLALAVRPFDSGLGSLALPYGTALAFVFMAAGGMLALACIATFVARGRGTPAPFDAPEQFVAIGPYKYVRNPMYIGGFVVLVGLGIYERSPSMLIFCVAWLMLAHLLVILYEEPNLERRFGSAYEDYRKRVPRWIPKLHRTHKLVIR